MKPTTLIVVGAAALCGGLPAGAQTSGNIAAAPHSTTGPTVPDPRQIDQGIVLLPGSNAAPTNSNLNSPGNWRTSHGFNTDPNNPNGAPGGSSVGANPTR